jgi:hypothetical protein
VRTHLIQRSLCAVSPFLLIMVLCGCTVVGSTAVFDQSEKFIGCRSTLGSYSLPKRVLHIQITKKTDDNYHILNVADAIPKPDNQHIFCLDHLRSTTANDEIRVLKNKITVNTFDSQKTFQTVAAETTPRTINKISQESTPYLQLVASKSVDHTAGIIRRFIRAAFVLLTNKGSFASARSKLGLAGDATQDLVVADFEVDPFDYVEMANVNQSVRKFGFCFVFEDHTFDRSAKGGPTPNQYCNTPNVIAKKAPPPTAEAIHNMRYLVPKPVDGIYFRPRASYRLSIYVKQDPDGRGTWTPAMIKKLEFENIMPIVSVGVSRAIFATRRTGLVFDDGMLTSVCITKGSEIEGAIQIPLDVIYGLVALPSETLIAATNDAKTAKDLASARQRLVTAQNNYIKFLNRETSLDSLQASLTNKAPTDSLSLGNAASRVPADPSDTNFPEDPPPDAGAISAGPNQGDALADICPELLAVKTSSPPTAPDQGRF